MAYEHTRKNYAHGIVGRIVQDDDPVNPRTDSEPLCRMTWKRVKPRPSGRGRKARSPSGLLWAPSVNQQP